MITQNDFLKMQNARKRAEEDDTPFLVMDGDKMKIPGDANKTQVKKHDYTIGFAFPATWKDRFDPKDIVKEVGQYIVVDIEYKDVFLNPRLQMTAISALVELEPFFNKVYDNGEVKDLTVDEVRDVLRYLDDDMTKALYHAVAVILGVDKSIEEYMLISDVIATSIMITEDFPEAINEANVFFELSSERVRKRANR